MKKFAAICFLGMGINSLWTAFLLDTGVVKVTPDQQLLLGFFFFVTAAITIAENRMKTTSKVLAIVVLLVALGCSQYTRKTTKVIENDQVVKEVVVEKTSYTGTPLEVSGAKINDSQSRVNDAVIDGDITAKDGATLLSVQTPMGQSNQSKRVVIDVDDDTHTRIDKNNSSGDDTPQQKVAKKLSGDIARAGEKKKGNK